MNNIVESLSSLACPIDKVQIDPKNARKHPERNLEAIKKSLTAYGQRKPIVVNVDTGIIEAGNGLYLAAKALGWDKIAVTFVNDASEVATAYGLMDNQSALIAEWDLPVLKDLLQGLDDGSVDMSLTGFSPDEIEGLMNQVHQGLTDDDEIPEKVETICKPGDLWILGNHRLLCGDSTKKEDVERLMGGEKADMVFTDPPYGANITGINQSTHASKWINRTRRWEQIKGDENEDADLQAFLESAFRNIAAVSKDNAAWYIWHAMLTQGFFAAAAAADLLLHRQIIWVKPTLILAFGHYHWRHELCFYGWKRGHEPEFFGETNSTTVWEIDFDGKGRMPKEERKHPTQKPVSLAEKAIKNSSQVDQNVIDLFGGSGTTLIACEKLKRKSYSIEIDPHYCDVIIQRWENYTGKKAELIK